MKCSKASGTSPRSYLKLGLRCGNFAMRHGDESSVNPTNPQPHYSSSGTCTSACKKIFLFLLLTKFILTDASCLG